MDRTWPKSGMDDALYYINSGYKPANLHQWGPGVRDVYALHLVITGRGKLEQGGSVFSLEAGQSFIIFPNQEIFYYPDLEDPWEYVWVEFHGKDASRLVELTQFSELQPVVTEAPDTLQPFYDLEWSVGASYLEQMRADAKVKVLLSYYMEYFPRQAEAEPKDYVWMARTYIEQNYWKPTLTVTEIVQAVNLERSYLFRLFKAATGESISAYLTSYRIRRACELLKLSGLSIQSIAYSVGYHDPLYFSRVFKKATSHTPSAYMMLHQKKRNR
nr:AraC family transcriptional regulator [Paenibacillus xylanexedens]